jgi:hypothetical protein
MDAFAWFRDTRPDYVPSTYHRFLTYKRHQEERKTPWTGYTHNKFLCYVIYFGSDPEDRVTMLDPRTNQRIAMPRGKCLSKCRSICHDTDFLTVGNRVVFSAAAITPVLPRDDTSFLSASGPSVDYWVCYWERTNDGAVTGSALSEQDIVEWLEQNPNTTVKDCITRFAEHLRDNEKNERERFTQIVRKIAVVQDQRLVLRPRKSAYVLTLYRLRSLASFQNGVGHLSLATRRELYQSEVPIRFTGSLSI